MDGFGINRYRRKRPKVDASIFDSALSHTRCSDASEKKEENSVSTFERFRLWTSFESSPVSVKKPQKPTPPQWLHDNLLYRSDKKSTRPLISQSKFADILKPVA